MAKLIGPLSGVQFLAITHPYTANKDRDAIMRNQENTLNQVRGTTEKWANWYLNEHPLGKQGTQESDTERRAS